MMGEGEIGIVVLSGFLRLYSKVVGKLCVFIFFVRFSCVGRGLFAWVYLKVVFIIVCMV